MYGEIALRTWAYGDKLITLFLVGKNVIAKIHLLNGSVEAIVPSYDINIPKEILRHPNPLVLPLFLENTYIRIARRNDGSFGLYINLQLNGGGVWDRVASIVCVGVGAIVLTAGTAIPIVGIAAPIVGSGLINAGINGFFQSYKSEKDFDSNYWKQAGIGFATGAILGGAGQMAGAITQGSRAVQFVEKAVNIGSKTGRITTATAMVVTKASINAAGGAIAQATNGLLSEGKIDTNKVLLGGALGFAIGGMVAKANLHNQNVVNTAAEEALKIGTKESSKIFLETVASGTGIALVEKVAEEAIQKGTPTVIAKVCEQLTRPEVQNIIILNAFPGALDCLAIMRSEKRANVRVNRANQRVIEAENAQEIAEQESHQKTEEVIALKAIAAQRLETIERQKQREKETKDQIAELVRRNSMEQNPPQESLAQHRDRMFTHLSSRLSSALPSDSPNRENTDEEHIGMHRRHPHLSSNEENGLPRRLFQ